MAQNGLCDIPDGYTETTLVDPFNESSGPFFQNLETRRCVLRATRKHCNALGVVHGGCLMAFADFSLFVIASHYTYEKTGNLYITVSFNCDFIGSCKEGALVEASGDVLKISDDKSMIFVSGFLTEDTRTIVAFRGVLRRAGASKTVEKRSRL